MIILGLICFLGTGFNVFGFLGGVFVGFFVGRYAGQKISKRIIKKHGELNQFDVFTVRLKCVMIWV